MDRTTSHLTAIVGLGGLLVAALVLSLGLGAVPLAPGRVLEALATRTPWGGPARAVDVTIVWDLRLVRALLAMLIGAGLAVAGAAFQGLFRNPLADPFVVGASGGAALGATLAITASLPWSLWGFGPVPLAAFVGALPAAAVVYAVAEAGGYAPAVALLLAGAALSTLLSAAVSLLMLLNDRALTGVFARLLGGLGGRSWPHLGASAPCLLAGLGALWLLARPLDALACGEETAQSLGLSLPRARGAVVAAASLTTAAAVAAGSIISVVVTTNPLSGTPLVMPIPNEKTATAHRKLNLPDDKSRSERMGLKGP